MKAAQSIELQFFITNTNFSHYLLFWYCIEGLHLSHHSFCLKYLLPWLPASITLSITLVTSLLITYQW